MNVISSLIMEQKKQIQKPFPYPAKKAKVYRPIITSILFSLLSCFDSGKWGGDNAPDIEEAVETSVIQRKSEINAMRQKENDKGLRRASEKGKHKNLNLTNGKEIFPPILEQALEKNVVQEKLEKLPKMSDSSQILSEDFHQIIYSALPTLVKGRPWVLLYSTWKHGISLHTLYRHSAHFSGPGLLVAVDHEGAVFGGLLSCPLKPSPKLKYQGTNDTFVFTNVSGKPKLYFPTGTDRYFVLCSNEALAFGGGDRFALCLEEELLQGTSGPSNTFGNCCLAKSTEFMLKHVELWGFAHASKYVPVENILKARVGISGLSKW